MLALIDPPAKPYHHIKLCKQHFSFSILAAQLPQNPEQ